MYRKLWLIFIIIISLSFTNCATLTKPSTSVSTSTINVGEEFSTQVAIQCDRIHIAVQSAIKIKRELLATKMITPQQSNQISQVLLRVALTGQEIVERTHALEPSDQSAKNTIIDLVNQIIKAVSDLNVKGVLPANPQIQDSINAIQAAAALLKPLFGGQ